MIAVQAVEYVDGGGRKRLQVKPDADRRKHRLWRARTRYGFEDGKTRQVERFGESPAKAENALKEALKTVQASTDAEVKRETRLRDLGERFLSAKAGRAPRTVETYERAVRKIITPRICDLAVTEATPDRLQRFLDTISAELGVGTAKTVRSVLSGMMGLATRADAVRTNPVRELAPLEQKAQGATPIPLGDLPGILAKLRTDKRAQTVDLGRV